MIDLRGLPNLLVVTIFVILMACADLNETSRRGSGVYHRVQKGETLYRIAQAYKIDIRSLARANNIEDTGVLEAGRALFIPNALAPRAIAEAPLVKAPDEAKITPPKPARPPQEHLRQDEVTKTPLPLEVQKIKPVIKDPPRQENPSVKLEKGVTPDLLQSPPPASSGKMDKTIFPLKPPLTPLPGADKVPINEPGETRKERKAFLWPVSGKVVDQFGQQSNGTFNIGIKIMAAENAPVVAAAEGTVIYSALLKDYGETIIIKHKDDYTTVYAHLGRRLVKGDAQLNQGEKIAFLNSTDSKEEPFLHFEVRHKNKAINPSLFLP